MHDVVNHFCRINACTTAVFEVHEKEARRLWKQRNRQKKWQSDYGEYAYLLIHPSSPEKIPVRRARKKPLAYSAGAAKRKEAMKEKSSSSAQKQEKIFRQKASFKEQAAERGSWQELASFEAAFQKTVQR